MLDVSKTNLKAFSSRLHLICDDLQISPARGRESQFAHMFKVTPNAARKWLRAEGMPELSRAIEICERANASVLWLLQGVGERRLDANSAPTSSLNEVVAALPSAARADVFEFVRYKLDRSAPLLAEEERVKYSQALEQAKGASDQQPS